MVLWSHAWGRDPAAGWYCCATRCQTKRADVRDTASVCDLDGCVEAAWHRRAVSALLQAQGGSPGGWRFGGRGRPCVASRSLFQVFPWRVVLWNGWVDLRCQWPGSINRSNEAVLAMLASCCRGQRFFSCGGLILQAMRERHVEADRALACFRRQALTAKARAIGRPGPLGRWLRDTAVG